MCMQPLSGELEYSAKEKLQYKDSIEKGEGSQDKERNTQKNK